MSLLDRSSCDFHIDKWKCRLIHRNRAPQLSLPLSKLPKLSQWHPEDPARRRRRRRPWHCHMQSPLMSSAYSCEALPRIHVYLVNHSNSSARAGPSVQECALQCLSWMRAAPCSSALILMTYDKSGIVPHFLGTFSSSSHSLSSANSHELHLWLNLLPQ